MQTNTLILLAFFTIHLGLNAQENIPDMNPLPYEQIPNAPEQYTAENVAARMIDGLGFRYYWATEGLTERDLSFRPNDEARTSFETLEHLFGLSNTIKNAVLNQPNTGDTKYPEDFTDLRAGTLTNLKTASDHLKKTDHPALEDCKIIFQRGDRTSEYPFWNLINGPIADALWHTGQIVSFRRSSGNPFSSKISLFSGRYRN